MKRQACSMLLVTGSLLLAGHQGALGEVVTDGSLGPVIRYRGPAIEIPASIGTQAGANLFHSFRQFNLNRGERATFSGPGSVQNIIGRVTGGTRSLIDGTLGSTIPGANLYLLNPAGVLIGEHARIDIGGSLFLSSANRLDFADGGRFSATPGSSAVLSVAAPTRFGFVNPAPAPLQLNGAQLEVREGQRIMLAGGDLTLQRGSLSAANGQVTLSAVSGPAEIALSGQASPHSPAADQGRITLQAGTWIDTSGTAPGRIFIRAGSIVADRAILSSNNFGNSDGAGIELQAAAGITLHNSQLQSTAQADGNAGMITLNSQRLVIDQGAGLLTASSGNGNGAGGDIQLDVSDRITIHGDPSAGGWAGGISASTFSNGPAGSIRIRTGELQLSDAWIEAQTNSGNSASTAGDIDLMASGDVAIDFGKLSTLTRFNSSGDAGDIRLQAQRLAINGNGGLYAFGQGAGAVGAIEVDVAELRLSDAGAISNESFGQTLGAKPIRVSVQSNLLIEGRAEPLDFNPGADRVSTGIFSLTNDITVSAADIIIRDSGGISSRTQNIDPSGNLSVSAQRITLLSGGTIDASSIGSSLVTGNGGNVNISASESLQIAGAAPAVPGVGRARPSSIQAWTRSDGDAGALTINTPLLVVEDQGIILTSTGVFGAGSAGSITINSDRLVVRNGGGVDSTSAGYGGGGDIRIVADRWVDLNHGYVAATGNREAASGTISIDTPYLSLRRAEISTASGGSQDAGDIRILTDRLDLQQQSTIRSNTFVSPILSSDPGGGDAGSVHLTATRLLHADDSEITTAALRGGGGNILLDARTLKLRATPVSATVSGGVGDGGNVTLDARALVAREESDITARADQGHGGRILVNADVFLRDLSIDLDASSNVAGNQGVVEVNAPESDVSASIKELGGDFLDLSAMLKDKCSARSSADQSSLAVVGSGALPLAPDDYLVGFAGAPAPSKRHHLAYRLAMTACSGSP